MNCKLGANSFQSVFKFCAISEQILCRHRHTDKNTSCCNYRVAFIAKTDMPSPVYCASVQKTSFLYECTTMDRSLLRNVHGRNITILCRKCVQTMCKTSLLYKCTQQDQKDLSNLPSYRVINCYTVMCSL